MFLMKLVALLIPRFQNVGYCLLLLKLLIAVAVAIAITFPTMSSRRDIQSKGPDDKIVTFAAAGGWITPNLAIAETEVDVARATRTQTGTEVSGIKEKKYAIRNEMKCPRRALLGWDAGAIAKPYWSIIRAPKGPRAIVCCPLLAILTCSDTHPRMIMVVNAPKNVRKDCDEDILGGGCKPPPAHFFLQAFAHPSPDVIQLWDSSSHSPS
mmetsp:Transcript_33071/g.67498  ORF Transcript_33071/g.67498 Transcript_33071/m.67498 type:complete len:210 (+) Transcript_33071:309-938(+)